MLIGRMNAGYEIIREFHAGNIGVVLAGNTISPAKYVTWEYTIREPRSDYSFYWGHYFQTWEEAKRDFLERIENIL